MIGKNLNNICKEDISLVQNYEKAVDDTTQIWELHHRLGAVISRQDLIKMDLYYNRPAIELIFVTREQHNIIHHKGKIYPPLSNETKLKISEACKGELNGFYGKNHSEETKKKMSEARIEYFKNHPEMIEKLSKLQQGNKYWLGKHHSEETKQKLSEIFKGRTPWNKGITGYKNKPCSEETKLKLSKANKGKKHGPMTEETKQKIANGNRGKTMTEEAKRKLSETQKLRWEKIKLNKTNG